MESIGLPSIQINDLMSYITDDSTLPTFTTSVIHPIVQGAYYDFFTNTYVKFAFGFLSVLTSIFVYIAIYGGYELTDYIFYAIS